MKIKALLAASAAGLCLSTAVSVAQDAQAVPQNDLLNATLWMQNSVEHKAVTRGLFDLAKLRLDQALADKAWTAAPGKEGAKYQDEPVAIIADLDETLLDNANYQSSLIQRGTNFRSKEWTDYVNSQTSTAMPGAIDFLKYADSKGVKIFYVSNRTKDEEPGTRANMEKLGFPMGGNVDTVLTKKEQPDWGSAKENRIAYVAKDYRVALLMGDNLGDFTDAAKGSGAERQAFYEKTKDNWGKTWIMFPNPEYGSWESAAFGGDWSKSGDERRKEKIKALTPWTPMN
ncbi:5'-nucleotidase, lipoprotein e(P4) family [Thioclava sp.]|uniref:5'-nucleotidase, lipoprotein e(P4) family n=1 Tax=Thioclava sp. TaxID=1933450 RepID=UPI003AA8A961